MVNFLAIFLDVLFVTLFDYVKGTIKPLYDKLSVNFWGNFPFHRAFVYNVSANVPNGFKFSENVNQVPSVVISFFVLV